MPRRRRFIAKPIRARTVKTRRAGGRRTLREPAKDHREQRLAQNRGWAAGHREELREQNRQYREDVRTQVFDHYGRSCACCGATENLTLDHVNGGGTRHRAEVTGQPKVAGWVFYRWVVKNGFPAGFQVLCFPCNQSKGTRERCRLNHEDRVILHPC
jgi:5-methylcytosine-specific restriction endonuclease McrA